jgi:broad-specificity NMP kinase
VSAHLIHLIGFPGVGKLTIAKEIIRLRTEYRLVDAHLINNPIFTVTRIDGSTPFPQGVWDSVNKIRSIVLDAMANLAPPHLGFVMTNVVLDDEEDRAECLKIEAVAQKRNCAYVPVILTCDLEENRRRIVSPEREISLKATNPALPDRMHGATPLASFEGYPNRIELDVTAMEAAESARIILETVDRLTA